MPFFDEKTGSLTFENGLHLEARMEREALFKVLTAAGGSSPDLGEAGIIAFPACGVRGGSLGLICFLREDRLAEVCLTVCAVGQRAAPTADQQRAFFFELFCLKDPCPDTRRNTLFKSEAASLSISTDPRLGNAVARVLYR